MQDNTCPIPETYIKKGNEEESKLTIRFWTSNSTSYEFSLTQEIATKIKTLKNLGIAKGVLIRLEKKTGQGQDGIDCVLEQIPNTSTLLDTDYNAFSMRKKVFHH